MIWFAKVAAAVLVVLTVLGTVLWADVTNRYLAASEARSVMGGAVSYGEIRIPLITSADQRVSVGVLFHVTNPSPIAVQVRTISYKFYMDDLMDTRSFAEKADSIYVGASGFYADTEGPTIPARGDGWIWANLTVDGALQPEALAHLNRTFLLPPRYFPIVDAGMVYTIAGTTIVDRVMGILFVTQEGVMPYGS